MDQGLIQVYMGEGKGKTCSALGLCLRAAGNNFSCAIVQFMKSPDYSGEAKIIAGIENITLYSFGNKKFSANNVYPILRILLWPGRHWQKSMHFLPLKSRM
ncbi:MAG: cob(I)yrinic acid a,c-diamide adenosyltransferase [Bacillota bacterium]|jgi:ATP:corrinoid adenosyltransferase